MRQRALIHVAGPEQAGKTTFIEALLRSLEELVICVRAEHDDSLRAPKETAPKAHAELRRYGSLEHVHLGVFVAPPLVPGSSLLVRVQRDHAANRAAALDACERALMRAELNKLRAAPPPKPTEHWAIAAGYEGIERAFVARLDSPKDLRLKMALGRVKRTIRSAQQ